MNQELGLRELQSHGRFLTVWALSCPMLFRFSKAESGQVNDVELQQSSAKFTTKFFKKINNRSDANVN